MIALLRERGWMAIPLAILLSGAAAVIGGTGHDHDRSGAVHSPSTGQQGHSG